MHIQNFQLESEDVIAKLRPMLERIVGDSNIFLKYLDSIHEQTVFSVGYLPAFSKAIAKKTANIFLSSKKRTILSVYSLMRRTGAAKKKALNTVIRQFRSEFLLFTISLAGQLFFLMRSGRKAMDVPRHIHTKTNIDDKTTDRRSPPDRRKRCEYEECPNSKKDPLSNGRTRVAIAAEKRTYRRILGKQSSIRRLSARFFGY